MTANLPDLPVRDILPALREALVGARSAVVVAPPGAGKTSLVPPSLLGEAWLENRKIVMLEPRRLAARAAARRIARLLGEGDAGGTVGYRVRMDTRVGPNTRIEVVTEGVLIRMLVSDPALSEVGAIVFDEFHERSLQADLALALALEARALFRDDLRLVVMSATLEPAEVAELLDAAPILRSEGRLHPVETRWLPRPVEGPIERRVSRTVRDSLRETEGDLLVFLPGAGEIRRTLERLTDFPLPDGIDVHPLFGRLSTEEQDRAISPAPPGRRKVVLASAVAETSLTIEGVRVVIDSGLMRVPRFDPGTGMTRLETVRVTRDSADQRRGRAGRLAPGTCLRLWTRAEDRGLVSRRTPEILEADLAPLAVDLAAWGAHPEDLRWLDPPPHSAFAQACELLRRLEILDREGSLTAHGREVARLGAHPRIGHLLVRGVELGEGPLACDLAALLEERDPVRGGGGRPAEADLVLRLDALRGRTRLPPGHRIDRGALHAARRRAAHWRRLVGVSGTTAEEGPEGYDVDGFGLLAALAYPDRIARRRGGQRGRFLLASGMGARLEEPQPLEAADWLAAVEVQAGGREARIFRAAALDLGSIEEHFAAGIEEAQEIAWNDAKGRVTARTVRRLGAIELSSSPLEAPEPALITAALLEGVRTRGLGALPWSEGCRRLLERLRFAHSLEPERWPDFSEDALVRELEAWLLPFLPGRRSLDDLDPADLRAALLSRAAVREPGVDPAPALDRLAPSRLEVPSGSRIPVDYSDPAAPVLAVRLQEVFGLTETPRVGGGRVPLTMHLLSPARRPVQVTRDLASFWAKAYFEVRKDLRGRYPRHHWPEDPVSAEPTRRARPR